MKNKIHSYIDNIALDLNNMADNIFDNPEDGLKEYKACDLLCNYLKEKEFKVEKGIGCFETAFRAVYEFGTGGPSIGLLCEYDALANIGHACGHHMQGPAILGAALALKEVVKDQPFKVVVYGTPAEETIGGKLQMVKEGCFKDIDVAMMMHGGPETTTDVKSLAMSKFKVIFNGKSAHAALKPENGKSALDALILSFQGIEFMREHVVDDVRMHYTILSAGGTAANVVPAQAIGSFYVRSYNRDYLNDVIRRFKNVMKGAALMTDTEYEIITEKEIDNKIPVLSLNDIVMENAKLVNAPTIRPPRQKTGSTDFGSVMYQVPGTCIRIAFVEEGTSSHSEEYLKAGKTDEAHNAIMLSAKILADSAYDLISNKELFDEVKEEFIRAKEAAKK
ncbi:amidohydrolase [Clostridium tetani]|uniref:M20 family metallopeptidase n=1 Tax=Clostridium tetani TaxID=1513 RepID=UPI0029545F3A|nr:M20 family metallopeptidase [Clostridium tetani]BDR68204.1 amidohydrolase [Clostridium tetani]